MQSISLDIMFHLDPYVRTAEELPKPRILDGIDWDLPLKNEDDGYELFRL